MHNNKSTEIQNNKIIPKSNSLLKTVFEIITTLAILLVLAQTFLEDLSVLLSWSPLAIFIIKITAIGFDLFFTFEFFTRLFIAISKKKGAHYFMKERGWIDLIASIPLLLLVSGPYFLQSVFGLSLATLMGTSVSAGRTLKIVKAIKVTRVLRFIRMLKIFGKIKNTRSTMTQRHIIRICTLSIFSLTFFIIVFNLISSTGMIPTTTSLLEKEEKRFISQINSSIEITDSLTQSKLLREAANQNPAIKYFSSDKEIYCDTITPIGLERVPGKLPNFILKKINDRETDELVSFSISVNSINFYLVFSRNEDLKLSALNDLVNFSLIIFIVLIFLLIYSPHFAKTITDPIFVMRKGFEQRNYTLMVKIPKKYKEDDIYKLSENYNNRWLPAKLRKLNSTPNQQKPMLRLKDILKGSALDDSE